MAEHGILHESSEKFVWLRPATLMSMLDLFGTFKATCIKCGRWQTCADLHEQRAIEQFRKTGWKMPEEVCPLCIKKKKKVQC